MSGIGDRFTSRSDRNGKPDLIANPLLARWQATTAGQPSTVPDPSTGPDANSVEASKSDIEQVRREAVSRYAFAIPTADALRAIARVSPQGVIEIGAGAGYWAGLLHQFGVDIVAFDPEPAPSSNNTWFSGTHPWHDVLRGDHHQVSQHPQRSLLVVWPTKNEIWAAEALERYFVCGGQCVIYVGEPPGGRTGDDVFHAILGDLTTCRQCRLGLDTTPCVCGVTRRWQRSATVTLPHWQGYDDDLHIYSRRPEGRIQRMRSKLGQ